VQRIGLTSAFVLFVAALSAAFTSANALQFRTAPVDDVSVIIAARGPIVSGDVERLREIIAGLPTTARILGLSLDSPGGDVLIGEQLAGFVRQFRLPVVVPAASECTSVCFLIFAAAPLRLAAQDALIGVHSVSVNGQETLDSMGLTTAMARDAAAYGVPPAIIGKMVQTQPGRVAWLTPEDLALMGVQIFPTDTSQSPPVAPNQPRYSTATPPAGPPQVPATPAPQAYAAPPPLPVTPGDQAQSSPAFQQGRADRQAWETWFGGLSGDFQVGAQSWAERRSTPKPGTCYSPNGVNLGAWTAGCREAQLRLGLADRRRKAEPEYRLGWNSY